MQFEIVTDSSSNLVEEMIDDFGLHVLPLTFMVDGEEYQSYLKGQHTDLKQFYTMMREGKVITTSLPNLAESEALMRGLLEQGRDVLYLGLLERPLRHLRGHRPSDARPGARSSPSAQLLAVDTLAASGGRGPARVARRADAPAPAPPSRRCATGWRTTSCTWPTGSRSTTSCSCSAAGACPRRAAWAGTHAQHQAGHARGRRGAPHPPGEGARPQEVAERAAWTTWRRRPIAAHRPSRWCSSPTATASRRPSTWPTR